MAYGFYECSLWRWTFDTNHKCQADVFYKFHYLVPLSYFLRFLSFVLWVGFLLFHIWVSLPVPGLLCASASQASMASWSNLHTRPIRIAGVGPSVACLQIVISWSFRYRDNSLVVMMGPQKILQKDWRPMTISRRQSIKISNKLLFKLEKWN